MAIDNQFGKGIGVAAGFDLGAQKPLDARIAVNTIAERDAHVENNRAYEGMIVFVDETKKNYQLINEVWVELLKAEQDRLDALEAMLNGEGEEGQAGGALGALQDNIDAVDDRLNEGGDIELRIAQNEADIDGLQGLVGQPAQAGEGEEEDIPATGLHLALDNAKAELEQAILTEKGRAEEQEAAIRQELADEAAEIRGEMAEQHEAMNKAVQEAIAAVQADVDQNEADCDAAIKAEKEAREAKDAELVQAIADEKAALQKEIDADIKLVTDAQDEVNEDFEGRIAANEAFIAAQPAKDQAQDEKIAALEKLHEENGVVDQKIAAVQGEVDAVEKRLDDEGGLVDRLEAVEDFKQSHDHSAMEQDIADNAAAIEVLNGEDTVEGSVKKQIKDAIDEVNGAAETLAGRVKANEDKLAGLENATVKAEIEAAQAAAEKHADDAITALVDSAPDAMNTLNELAKAINDNKGIYDAWVEQHNQAMADMKKDLQDEIDVDVKVVADELAKQKDAAQDGTLANQIKVESERAVAKENEIAQALANEKNVNIDGSLAKQINAVSASVTEQGNFITTLQTDLTKEADRAKGEEADIRADFAAADAALKAELQAEIDADVKVEKERAEGQEAAIRGEFAAADTALHATIKSEMAAVIQSLSASITEDGMLRIALGGIENDEVLVIREQKIPFVSDEDIDDIIASLDEEDEPAEGQE